MLNWLKTWALSKFVKPTLITAAAAFAASTVHLNGAVITLATIGINVDPSTMADGLSGLLAGGALAAWNWYKHRKDGK